MEFRRLLLDLSHPGGERLDIAAVASLARLLGLDLVGVFVEDEALLGLSNLTGARELRLPGHDWQPIRQGRILEELSAAAGRAQRRLDAEAARLAFAARFERRRGDPARTVADMVLRSDIVALAATSHALDHLTGTLVRARDAALGSAASVLLLPPRSARLRGPIAALADGDTAPGIELSARIAAVAGEDLVLLMPRHARTSAEALAQRAAAAGLDAARIMLRHVDTPDAEGVLRALRGMEERLVVLTRQPGDGLPVVLVAARGVPVLLAEPQEDGSATR